MSARCFIVQGLQIWQSESKTPVEVGRQHQGYVATDHGWFPAARTFDTKRAARAELKRQLELCAERHENYSGHLFERIKREWRGK